MSIRDEHTIHGDLVSRSPKTAEDKKRHRPGTGLCQKTPRVRSDYERPNEARSYASGCACEAS